MNKIIDVDALINPTFDDVLLADAPNKALEGGRASTKSSAISTNMVMDFIDDPEANALIMRKVANTIELSVYEQIKWAIDQLGLTDQFRYTKSPYRIIHIPTGTGFYFSGVDDPMKLKSMIIAHGYVRWLWFEELAEFDSWQQVDTVRLSFTRKKLPPGKVVETFYSWNPPRNPYDWINAWVETRRGAKGWYVHHSTYLDDELHFLSDQYLEEIEEVKRNDYDYYRWQYLGEAVGLGTNVYNMSMFHALDTLPTDDPLTQIFYATDSGHAQSATTTLLLGLTAKKKVVLLDTLYYSPQGKVEKKAPSELSAMIHDYIKAQADQSWGHLPVKNRTIDSAEAALRNQYYRDYRISWHPVAKKKKSRMIDDVHSLLANGRFYYLDTPNNTIFIEQHRNYRWEEKSLKTDDPKVVKEDDHTCDAFQYFVIDNAKLLGLKV